MSLLYPFCGKAVAEIHRIEDVREVYLPKLVKKRSKNGHTLPVGKKGDRYDSIISKLTIFLFHLKTMPIEFIRIPGVLFREIPQS